VSDLGDPGFAAGLHPTAVIDDGAVIPESCVVGPYAVIGPGVELGEHVRVGPHVLIERDTRIGDHCRIAKGAALGVDPQDLKYMGERTWLQVGPHTTVREFATLSRGTAASGTTVIGSDCLVMSYVHVAHDCRIGSHVILANTVQMGGHVEIGDWAVVGGIAAIHQFVRIGRHAMVGGASAVTQDVAPYTLAAGNPCACFGLNRVGLQRRGFSPETVTELRAAYRAVFGSAAGTRIAAEGFALDGAGEEVRELIEFVRSTSRGLTTPGGGRRIDLPGPPGEEGADGA
jgi:UDP-N-acetylglucosamine acyltransferase